VHLPLRQTGSPPHRARQRKAAGEQLSFDDLGGRRFFAVISNIPPMFAPAIDIDHHHRLRGSAPEEAIRQLKEDFGMNHAPLRNFFGNWLWWLAAALAYNVARWVRVLALPETFRTCRGKRLRASFFDVPARVVRTAHRLRLRLRLPRAYRHADAFATALNASGHSPPTPDELERRRGSPPGRRSHAPGQFRSPQTAIGRRFARRARPGGSLDTQPATPER
jgi:hypothetical protein